MQIIYSAETWSERREAERAARWFNQFAQATEYAVVDEPASTEPCYRLRVVAYQPQDYVGE